ncbi:MAG: hypothetical protein ACOYOK_06590 [Pseudobdellovibrionaceae bacterium]
MKKMILALAMIATSLCLADSEVKSNPSESESNQRFELIVDEMFSQLLVSNDALSAEVGHWVRLHGTDECPDRVQILNNPNCTIIKQKMYASFPEIVTSVRKCQ